MKKIDDKSMKKNQADPGGVGGVRPPPRSPEKEGGEKEKKKEGRNRKEKGKALTFGNYS